MNYVFNYIQSTSKYQHVLKQITNESNKNILFTGTTANISLMLAVFAYEKMQKTIVYVCENTYEASIAYEKLSSILGEKALFYPIEEFISADLVASSTTFKVARMMTLHQLAQNNTGIVITTPEGLCKKVLSKDNILNSVINLKVGDIYNSKDLIKELYNRGYKKVSKCEETGTFAVRGYVIDIYPINTDTMYRVSYFDDEIESIKEVEIDTQKSIKKVDSLEIFPLYDIYYKEEDISNIVEKIKNSVKVTEKVEKDINRIVNYNELDQINIYIPYIDSKANSLLSLISNPICMFSDVSKVFQHEKEYIDAINDYLSSIQFDLKDEFFYKLSDLLVKNNKNIYISEEIPNISSLKLDVLEDLKTLNVIDLNNNLKNLTQELDVFKDKTFVVTHFDDKKLGLIREILNNSNIKYNDNNKISIGEVNLLVSNECFGMYDADLNLEVITPYEYSSGKINKSSKYSKYYKHSTKIYNKEDIYPGDYVIHQDYGIGKYLGIEQREMHGRINDCLSIEYKDNHKLLIPVEKIYILEKYNPGEGVTPKLNNLTGTDWTKKKAKIKDELFDVAKKLIKVQEERKLRKGYIYSKDSLEQIEFEKDFTYKETADQIKAITDVKEDMESECPVDRLICGDVGFGKTEVAMRAAFKAVMSGKQVAYLAPTTVLTRQHYYSFKERFEKYGVRVELLNRFVPASRQKQNIEGLKSGYVDIIIGTHRLLSDDVKYKDLGLLIIDEEQRFGVMHKEKIKMLKTNVDVLTLTATPIPRTLQMSLNGIKDLSVIETPPTNRLPVQTYVLEHNDSVIKEAINREKARNGQVFYLINRINELDLVEIHLKKLCPNIKIGKIHGQMDKDTIEDELVKFLDKEYDLLLCTTIIETGIDVPNANTIIIDHADILGLSQLYQIRGRVGRSDRISYAYLMYKQASLVTEDAKKRLNAIKEFTALGSGYKIAMRDLAIRGAGDILGEKQSGFINSIGLEMYNKLLNEVISELKGIKIEKEEVSKKFTIDVDKHIDDIYIPDEDIRIYAHKEVNLIKSRQKLNEVIDEFNDRFGRIPEDVLVYMNERYLNHLLKLKGVQEYKDKDGEIYISFDESKTKEMDFKYLATVAKNVCPKFEFGYKFNCLNIYIKKNNSQKYIYELIDFLEKM